MNQDGPTTEDVLKLGGALGFDLSVDEAQSVLQNELAPLIDGLDVLDDYDSYAEAPPTFPSDRSRHDWAAPEDDPHRCFITRCDVEGAPEGPLHGLRLSVKDCITVAGLPTTLGLRSLTSYTADFDATIVHRALAAGARVVGKNNMEPFCMGVSTGGARDFGTVRNPWDAERSPGGSSSGSAAAVAAGLADLAFGTDSGGSVRIPAAWCGVAALKPTHGILPLTGITGFELAEDHAGPMARDVATIARAMNAVAGPDGFDLRQGAVPRIDFEARLDDDVRGVRVGVLEQAMGPAVEPDIARAVDGVMGVLSERGASVERVSIPVHTDAMALAAPLYYESVGVQFMTAFAGRPVLEYVPPAYARAMATLCRERAETLPLNVKGIVLSGQYLLERYQLTVGARIASLRRAIAAAYDEVLRTCDVLAMPTVPLKAPRFERDRGEAGGRARSDAREFAVVAANTWGFNLTGHPAISVPCAVSAGLPIGLQLVAAHFADDVLLQVGSAIQREVPWDALAASAAHDPRDSRTNASA